MNRNHYCKDCLEPVNYPKDGRCDLCAFKAGFNSYMPPSIANQKTAKGGEG